jgi:hypothetical protein
MLLNFGSKIEDEAKEITQINQEIYSSRKSADSPRGFGFEETRTINPRALP